VTNTRAWANGRAEQIRSAGISAACFQRRAADPARGARPPGWRRAQCQIRRADELLPGGRRSLAKRLRLPRRLANDGKALVVVDVPELAHKPMPAPSPAGDHLITAMLKAHVEALQAELAKVQASRPVTGRTSSARENVQPRKRRPGSTASWRPCDGVGWWDEVNG
jgi:hypothetical protein